MTEPTETLAQRHNRELLDLQGRLADARMDCQEIIPLVMREDGKIANLLLQAELLLDGAWEALDRYRRRMYE